MNNIVSAYEDIVKTNNKITDAHNQLADGLIELLKKIEVCQCRCSTKKKIIIFTKIKL